MDVWTLGEKYKAQEVEIKKLEARIKHMEEYLSVLTKQKEVKKDEKLQDKKASSSRVRTRRPAAAKS
jgi:hypothetical protein